MMHGTSVEVYETKKSALVEGDEVVVAGYHEYCECTVSL